MSKALLTVSQFNNMKALNDAVRALAKKSLYVGIAKGSSGDKRTDGAPDNHLLGFVHEKGSPIANIPPRPFLVPGVESVKDDIKDSMGKAMELALKDKEQECDAVLERTAIKTATAVKEYMTTADFEPLKPATIRNRHRSRLTQSMREEEINEDISQIQPLINTGSLRNSIDGYFVKE